MAHLGEWAFRADILVAFFCGALVGFSEILSRYRDEPLKATVNQYGLTYLAINGAVSVAAFGLLQKYPDAIFPKIAGDPFMGSLVAGFGAMAVMRSKLFIFRSDDGKEYPIGPAIVIETLLRVIDRKIDRLRASQREKRVFLRLKDVTNFSQAADYLEASLLSFQNLTVAEKSEASDVIKQLRGSPWPASLKTLAVGFMFLNVAGEENFDQVFDNLTKYLEEQKQVPSGGPPPAATQPITTQPSTAPPPTQPTGTPTATSPPSGSGKAGG